MSARGIPPSQKPGREKTLRRRIIAHAQQSKIRHPGESRDPLNLVHASSAAQIVLIQWVPAFAGMTNLHAGAAGFPEPAP